MRAHVQAGGRDDDGCARGHFSKSLHICENLPPALHVVILVTCVLGGELPQLSSCKQNVYITWWVGQGGAMVAGTCGMAWVCSPCQSRVVVRRTAVQHTFFVFWSQSGFLDVLDFQLQ